MGARSFYLYIQDFVTSISFLKKTVSLLHTPESQAPETYLLQYL